jgi:hypothetical protein
MEIFDYLYGQDIVFAFSDLNSRFNSLCIHYSKYHINASYHLLTRNKFNHLLNLIYSKHIRSLKLKRERWIRRISTKHLFSLCSLTFDSINNPTIIKQFIENLPSLHHLQYLSINLNYCKNDIEHMIRSIFKLRNLHRLDWDSYFNKQDFGRINQSLLSLRYLTMKCYERKQFLRLIPFIPNLISLNILYQFDNPSSDLIFIQRNSLSKLKSIQINNIRRYDEIDCIFQLCLQIKICKLQCNPSYGPHSLLKARNWEELLSPMSFLEHVDIKINHIRQINLIHLSEYQTNFWIQTNLKAILYDDPRPYSTSFSIKSQ